MLPSHQHRQCLNLLNAQLVCRVVPSCSWVVACMAVNVTPYVPETADDFGNVLFGPSQRWCQSAMEFVVFQHLRGTVQPVRYCRCYASRYMLVATAGKVCAFGMFSHLTHGKVTSHACLCQTYSLAFVNFASLCCAWPKQARHPWRSRHCSQGSAAV